MVRVEMVPRDFEPPLDERYALVDVARSGTAYFQTSKDEQIGTFKVNNDPAAIATAIEDAREWAAQHGVDVVYVARPEPDIGA